MTEPNQPAVAVIGSLNIDYVTRVARLPSAGETVASEKLDLFRGGKGANQAISAARQGSRVRFLGTVGEDQDGQDYLRALEEEGIDVKGVRTAACRTGVAFITVDGTGENTIVIAPGANGEITPERVVEESTILESSAAVLMQFEVPLPALIEASRIANGATVPVVLNPSPYRDDFPWHEVKSDYLIVNEGEAALLLDFDPLEEEDALVRQRLHELRIDHLLVTRGGSSTLVYLRTGEPFEIDTLPVLPVDTVGAGDAFAGCFTARIASGDSLEEAVRAANCAGALTTLGSGAQAPIPDRVKVDQHLEHLRASS